ncbi:YjcG family protein [Oceanobacillus neutriphilus]|uniref:Putative phosphoesterase GCM10011346_38630 n=1 Tax=Oceanobacillus neutriphilus TaxID=531815 RepID=A0ABQ2NZS3_9BACI|nr:YjcG family protein [Oceanobacillus neutriphilus]GGP14485.1 putative phosphoesterase [Oceanobacillus neutriphilus]
MKYGIAIFPSKTVQDQANALRKRYDPRYSLIPPHITLKYPFETNSDEIDEVVQALHKIAGSVDPFYIHINKVSTFEPVTNTIYLKVEPIEQLKMLNEQLQQGIFENNQDHSFVPHITIAQDLVHDEFRDVVGRLKMEGFEIKDYIDRFQLLYELENGSWTVYETFLLGKE